LKKKKELLCGAKKQLKISALLFGAKAFSMRCKNLTECSRLGGGSFF
jgi:hypothetical protein